MKSILWRLCAIFFLVESVLAEPEQFTSLKIGVAEWPPYVDENHIALGLVPEVIQLSFLQKDMAVEFVVFKNWSDCSKALLTGEIQASGPYTPTEKRKKEMRFSNTPILELTTAVFYLRQNLYSFPDANLFENQQAYSGAKIAGMSGYFYEDLLKGLNILYGSKTYENFQKLYTGKVDLVIENELIGWHTISQLHPYAMSKFGELKGSTAVHGGYLVVNKSNENGAAVIKIFDQGLGMLQKKGLYLEVLQKYKESFKRLFD